jgi:hypothetical protein
MTEILVSLFGALGTVVASYFAYAANRQSRRSNVSIEQINDAVNHRHKTGTPRLYDMVLSNFNRVDSLEKSVIEIKRDIKDLSHVASVHQLEIDKIEEQIGEE